MSTISKPKLLVFEKRKGGYFEVYYNNVGRKLKSFEKYTRCDHLSTRDFQIYTHQLSRAYQRKGSLSTSTLCKRRQGLGVSSVEF